MRTTKPKLSEADIQQACCELLVLDGWRVFRTELTVQRERGRVVGERYMPDVQAIRYWTGVGRGIASVLYVEFKAPGKAPNAGQLAWHDVERARGGIVVVADDIDNFKAWYLQSGLNRSIRP